MNWTTDYFSQSSSTSPRLDAEVLLAHACQCQRIELYTTFDQVPEPQVVEEYRELVRKRAAGTPVAYLVGYREFYSLDFRVTPAVLIPRPETEFLVMTALDRMREMEPVADEIRLADVGTGSGIIPIALLKHVNQCKATAIDISEAALEIARQNAEAHDVLDRITFLQSDLLDGLNGKSEFDLVVSNPPYIGENERKDLAVDVVEHEPHQALFAGPDGMAVINRLVPQAANQLRSEGWLLMEISPLIEEAVLGVIEETKSFQPPSIIKDLAGHARVVQAQRV